MNTGSRNYVPCNIRGQKLIYIYYKQLIRPELDHKGYRVTLIIVTDHSQIVE
jgi:hypothetical protein